MLPAAGGYLDGKDEGSVDCRFAAAEFDGGSDEGFN